MKYLIAFVFKIIFGTICFRGGFLGGVLSLAIFAWSLSDLYFLLEYFGVV
jgi:hypothetical protein